MELNLQVSSEEIMSREVELSCESWTSFASSCLSTTVHGQWQGDTTLTLLLFWRRSTGSPDFFGRYPRSILHSFVPFPPSPPPPPPPPPPRSPISHLASVDVKQNGPPRPFIVQELCESRGGCPGLSVLTSLLVSVDVKLY